mgnify:CR=1 FL=1
MHEVREAMTADEVRTNLRIQAAGHDGNCPGCGRRHGHEEIPVYVPGRPDEELDVRRCSYCETLFEPDRQSDVRPELGAAIEDLRPLAREAREATSRARRRAAVEQMVSLSDASGLNVGTVFSPAAFDIVLSAAGVNDLASWCKQSEDNAA